VYDRARYDLSLDYDRPLALPLAAVDAEWFQSLDRSRTRR
jgi:hypothetical protein